MGGASDRFFRSTYDKAKEVPEISVKKTFNYSIISAFYWLKKCKNFKQLYGTPA